MVHDSLSVDVKPGPGLIGQCRELPALISHSTTAVKTKEAGRIASPVRRSPSPRRSPSLVKTPPSRGVSPDARISKERSITPGNVSPRARHVSRSPSPRSEADDYFAIVPKFRDQICNLDINESRSNFSLQIPRSKISPPAILIPTAPNPSLSSVTLVQEMGLWTLLEGCLLLANALAILNEDRFLAPRRWSFQEYSGVTRNSFKGQILGLIYATQYLRVPLILLNLLCIVVKMVSG
ncbi:hypothetical protein PHJA_000775400 [Phtheirospermum japonicum]|uniref:Immediate early response 3-interacting protein 1 n=1 Tax=Phtheirospermum japonicum TaxID=374723 RepID=A0A830BHD0_9LAMI|nr:hypothetical protein PHJA_000775400 [Phtheirospermum japonicum]